MLTITFAFVVATCLFLWFSQTRALGVVGVFILLCINPLLFGGLLVLGAYVWNRWLRKRYYPLPTFIPKDKKNTLIPLMTLPWLGNLVPTAEAPTVDQATVEQTTVEQTTVEQTSSQQPLDAAEPGVSSDLGFPPSADAG
jgi:hypothetical protein